MKRCEKFMGTI